MVTNFIDDDGIDADFFENIFQIFFDHMNGINTFFILDI